jgi:hypothetical protein
MERIEVVNKIIEFIRVELLQNPLYNLEEDEPLFSNGSSGSFAIAQIGVINETKYNLYIPDPDLTVDNMETVDQITNRILSGLSTA